MNFISMDSITEVFYHLNKMLIATKHIADNNLSFSKTVHWHILYATQSKPLNFTFLTYDPNSPDVIGEPH